MPFYVYTFFLLQKNYFFVVLKFLLLPDTFLVLISTGFV